MSLDFSYENVRDSDEASTDPQNPKNWHPVGKSLVWASLACGFSKITEKNVDDVAKRIRLWELVNGPFLHLDGKKSYLTRKDVERYIGLSTNVSDITTNQFLSKIYKTVDDFDNAKSCFERIQANSAAKV